MLLRTAALAGVLVLGTATSAVAAVPPPRDTASACPSGIADSGLGDLTGEISRLAVNCTAAWGVAAGRGGSYLPRATVSRGQMATFLTRLLDAAQAGLPPSSRDAFSDDDGSIHEGPINRLAEAGLVNGTAADTFDREGTVTRGQMATFLANALVYAQRRDVEPPEDYFSDDNGSVHEPNINKLAAVAVATGTGPGTYRPRDAVSRGQMALFLSRLLDALVDDAGVQRPAFPLWQLRPGGVGPFTATMTVREAERLSPAGFELGNVEDFGGYCYFASSREKPELYFIVINDNASDPRDGILEQAAPGDSSIPADGGLRLGSTRAEVEAAFPGQLEEEPNVYRPDTGVYLTLHSGPRDALRFLIDDDVVYEIYAGTRNSVEYIEGCA